MLCEARSVRQVLDKRRQLLGNVGGAAGGEGKRVYRKVVLKWISGTNIQSEVCVGGGA